MSNRIKGIIFVREKTDSAPKIIKLNGFVKFLLKTMFLFFVIASVALFALWARVSYVVYNYNNMQRQNDSLIVHAKQIDSLKTNLVRINRYLEYFRMISPLNSNGNIPPTIEEYLKNAEIISSLKLPDAQRDFRRVPRIRPVSAGVISRGFNAATGHKAVDFAAPVGTPIRATADGVVVSVENLPDLGNVVVLKHAGGYQTLYGHCQRILVRVGQNVVQGETIALVGNTGNSSGSHLHYEVLRNGVPIDPQTLFM